MTVPQRSVDEAQSQQTFLALMWALSQPGRVWRLPAAGLAAFGAIAEALVDLETSYYTEHRDLQEMLARTGGRAKPLDAAMYQFYPHLSGAQVPGLGEAPAGNYSYPDESATLVIGCALGGGRRLRLQGPGIATTTEIQIDGIPEAFWSLREHICHFPLGWDVLLVADDQVIGLPRTTRIEVV